MHFENGWNGLFDSRKGKSSWWYLELQQIPWSCNRCQMCRIFLYFLWLQRLETSVSLQEMQQIVKYQSYYIWAISQYHVIKTWQGCIWRDEILSYIYSAVDHFGIGTHFKFNSGMKSATWDETTSSWNVETESGIVYNGKFLINCMGFLYKELFTNQFDSFDSYIMTHTIWVKQYGNRIKAKLSKTERNGFIQRQIISLCPMGRWFWLHWQEGCCYRKRLYCYPRNRCFSSYDC